MYLYIALIRQVALFQEFIQDIKINLGIVSHKGTMNELDHLNLQEQFECLQNVYSMYAANHFFHSREDLEQDQEEDIDIDGSSISSDLSDDNHDIEGFESATTMNLIKTIKINLRDEDIYEASKSHYFITFDGQLNLLDFFMDTLQLTQVNQYQILCLLQNSGIYLKTLLSKSPQINSILKQFIINFQNVVNKIISLTGSQLDDFLMQNNFGQEGSQITRRMFFSRKNILKKLFYEVLSEKIQNWREIHLINQETKSQFQEEVSRSYEKKYLRQVSQRWNIPLNRFEVKVLSWDQGQLLLNQQNQITYSLDHSKKIQSVVLKLYPYLDDFYNFFVEQDRAQRGMLEFHEFFKALKSAALPITARDAQRAFQESEEVQGMMSADGVKVRRLINYQNFCYKIFGLEEQPQHLNTSFSFKGDQPTKILEKYSQEVTNNLMVKNMSHKNKKLLDGQNQLKHQLKQYEDQIQKMKESLDKKDQMIQSYQQVKDQSANKLLEAKRNKDLENIENLQNYSNINQSVLNGYKIKETQWQQERNLHIRELNHKDRQIQQYRIELEGLVNEMAHVKTQRIGSQL